MRRAMSSRAPAIASSPRSRNIKNRLYDRARKPWRKQRVKTSEAQGQIGQELAQLNEAPETNAAEIGFMEKLKSDLSQPQTVGSIRRIRTSLRGQINQANLTATTAEARAMRVLDAAKNDIQRDAPPEKLLPLMFVPTPSTASARPISTRYCATFSASATSPWTARRRLLA
jgi:hypothetical protein